jgi:hypothetical protein
MGVGERDEGSQSAEKVEWLEDQVGGPSGVGPRTAQAVDDLSVGVSGKAFLGEGSAQAVTEEALQGFPIVSGDGLCGMEREALDGSTEGLALERCGFDPPQEGSVLSGRRRVS